MFRADPDTVHTLILWDGVNREGLPWLRDWVFTQDNWLLSLAPFHFLGYAVFGAAPEVAVVGGWIIFALSALLAGLIARQLGARRAAPWVTVALLFAGRYVHAGGFASYAASHNITNLYGLAALLLILHWLEHRGHWKLLALAWLLIAGGVSDPWMLPTFQLPILLAAVGAAAIPHLYGGARADAVKIAVIAALSILAVKTQLFGALDFLPKVDYQPGTLETAGGNFAWLFRDLGGLLNLVPNFPPSQVTDWGPAFFSLICVTALFAALLASAVRRKEVWLQPLRAFIGIASSSVAGIAAASVISSVPADGASARFLLNCLYLAVIMLGVLVEREWDVISQRLRAAAVGVAALFVIAGMVSSLPVLNRPGFYLDNAKSRQLIDFLKENNLSEGYGPYWGSYAHAVTAVSGFSIRLLPVVFDHVGGEMIAGTRAQTSTRWGRPEADAAGGMARPHFVIVKADGEECPDPSVCIAGLNRQFGPPVRELKYQDATILVWDHPLIGWRP